MSETYSDKAEWECPHCGEKNYVEESDYAGESGIVYEYKQCPQCECYAYVEFEKVITVTAREITRDEFPTVIDEFVLSADDHDDVLKLEESLGQE